MKKPPALNVNIIYNRSNTSGLVTVAQVFEELLRLQKGVTIGQIHHVDPREPPRAADVNFHLEVPIYGLCAWAASNIFLMNPEHASGPVGDAFSKYMHAFNAVIVRVPGGPVEFGGLPVRSVVWESSASSAAATALAEILADCQQRRQLQRGPVHLPPILQADSADCPPITVVTLTYNRRNFIDLACLNILLTDYPRDKIEWLVVEDSDDQAAASSDKIIGFASKNPDITVSYMPLEKRTSIGEKRNKAVEKAMHDIILFMDDDDVYPETSFRRRVAWLLKGSPYSEVKPSCVVSTMLAMYDLRTGKSAVNLPPLELPLGQRVSEATLTFRKSFWQARPFPSVNIAEGDDWLAGREAEVLEIPPQQIIVALSHGANVSSRTIPADARVGCFWGWDEHMIRFLHGRIGVAVEADGGKH